MSANLPWLRLWTKFRTDPAVQMLAFEDQRHFIIALCMKGEGILDKEYATPQLRNQVIAKALGLDLVAAAEALRRLREAGLIDEHWQPVQWEKNQPASDHNAAERKRNQRQRERQGLSQGVTVTGRDSHGLDTDEDTDTDKNPPNPPKGGNGGVDENSDDESPGGEPEKPPGIAPTAVGALAVALREAGVICNVSHPNVVEWTKSGVTVEVLNDAIAIARQSKPWPERLNPGYINAILRKPQRGPPARESKSERADKALANWMSGKGDENSGA